MGREMYGEGKEKLMTQRTPQYLLNKMEAE